MSRFSTKSSNDNRVFIAVMGPTGSGKSSFINLASGTSLRVGEGLESCTDEVHVSRAFNLDGRRTTLIDTPGFDDTNKSDTDILAVITAFLEALYKKRVKLSGVVYIHRISDFRMGGSSRRNFKLFCNLCGDDALKNSVLVTNMWGKVDVKKGEKREAELRDKFFKSAIDKGAQLIRHDNTAKTAHNILRYIINNRRLPLRIQIELVDEKKKLLETVAGEVLNREMLELTRKEEAEIKQLQDEMGEAMQMKDEQTRQELDDARREIQEKIDSMKPDAESIGSAHRKQKTIQKQRVGNLADNVPQDKQVPQKMDKMDHDVESHESTHRKQLPRELQKSERNPAGDSVLRDGQDKLPEEGQKQKQQMNGTTRRTATQVWDFAGASPPTVRESLQLREQLEQQQAWAKHTGSDYRVAPEQQKAINKMHTEIMDRLKVTEDRQTMLKKNQRRLEQECRRQRERYDRDLKRAESGGLNCVVQ